MPRAYDNQTDFDRAFEALRAKRKGELAAATDSYVRAVTGLRRLERDPVRDAAVIRRATEVLIGEYGFDVCDPCYLPAPDGGEKPCYAVPARDGCKHCELRDAYAEFLIEDARRKAPGPQYEIKLENDIWPTEGEERWLYMDGKTAVIAVTPVGGPRPLCFADEASARAFFRFAIRYPELVIKHGIRLSDQILTRTATKNLVTVRYLARVIHDPAETGQNP